MAQDYGLKVSLPGKDISSSDPRDFVFNSGNPVNAKIVIRSGTTTTVNAGAYASISITHNLGFIPMCMVFVQSDPSTNIWRFSSHFSNVADAYVDGDGTNTYADDTYLKIRIYNGFGSQKTIAFYYYIFGDSAN